MSIAVQYVALIYIPLCIQLPSHIPTAILSHVPRQKMAQWKTEGAVSSPSPFFPHLLLQKEYLHHVFRDICCKVCKTIHTCYCYFLQYLNASSSFHSSFPLPHPPLPHVPKAHRYILQCTSHRP